MLFAKNAVGIEIGNDGLKMAVIGGKSIMPRLDAWQSTTLPAETVRFSHREANVLNAPVFVSKIRDTYIRLLTGTRRVSLSLPDTIGQVRLLELETRFKSRDEGADIIRWKLKKSLPFDVNEAHLDYQVLTETDTGEIAVLVSLIMRQVVNQYEELLLESGLEPVRIDFTSFNLYRLYSRRLELAESSVVISHYGGMLSILIFHDGVLDFYRVKELSAGKGNASTLFREINSSLLVYRDTKPARTFREVFFMAPQEEAEPLRQIIAEICALEPVLLDVGQFITRREGVAFDRQTLYTLAAAVGAAMRAL